MFRLKKLFILIFVSIYVFCETTPATHFHSQHHHHGSEREEDGGFSPRDSHHYGEDGAHHSEFDHEAILGSVKDAEEFDQLEPEEAKKRLRILLKKMDLNNDELIERNELHAWILRSFKMLSEEESQDRFEDADENEDGKVTWQEYVADSYGIQDNEDLESRSISSDDNKLMQDDKIMFDAADRNKDGVLENSEFIFFTHPEEHPEMLPLVLQQTLNDKDADKDGFINFQEFVGDQGKRQDKEWLITEKDKFDHDYDKDGDGRLNGAEILSWIVPSNDEIAEEEVSHLFASSDDNEDGVLSYQEVLDHHQTFVGSEATDYGDHLHNIHVFQDEL